MSTAGECIKVRDTWSQRGSVALAAWVGRTLMQWHSRLMLRLDAKPLHAAPLPAQCNGTIIGDRRTGGCLVCKPDNPTFCLKASLACVKGWNSHGVHAESPNCPPTGGVPWAGKLQACLTLLLQPPPRPASTPTQCAGHCNPYGCISSFVTRDGACSECPIWAAACEDVTGVPTKCRDGYGLVAGECRRCFNEKHNGTECRQCNGGHWDWGIWGGCHSHYWAGMA